MHCCSIKFHSRNKFLFHIQTEHLKFLSIGTDKGKTLDFTRSAPGKFKCPTCNSVCTDIQSVLIHLLCEQRNDYFRDCSPKKMKTKNSFNVLKDSSITITEIERKNDTDYFNFLLTSSAEPADSNRG